jgi:hypothetical protein
MTDEFIQVPLEIGSTGFDERGVESVGVLFRGEWWKGYSR